MEKIKIPCPFCENNIDVLYQSSGFVTKKSHAAGRTKSQRLYKPLNYEPLEDCPNCRKTKKEIKRAFEGDIPSKPKTRDEVRKQLEEVGLLGKFSNEK